uniref:Carboxylesterase type B domain-containing protein n=1 Tax=Acrobeloides nanus TaxID=290746 RepID=A0A914DCX3_9BILA
ATKELAKALNCGNEDSKKVKDCLKSKTVDEILEAVKETGPSRKGINFSKYEPRVDGDFFPEDYLELIKNAPKKPAMIGFTEVESAIFTLIMGDKTITSVYIPSEKYQEFGEDSLKQFIKEYVASEAIFGEKAQEVQDKVFEFYGVRNQPKNVDYKFYIDRYTQILSDTQFIIPGLLTAQEKLKNDWPVYLYQNEHYNKKNFPDDFPVKGDHKKTSKIMNLGALHGSEYTYLHGTTFGPTEFDEDDRKFQKLLTESVANFVKTGWVN